MTPPAAKLSVQQADGVALITLLNPPLNLVSLALTRELGETLDRLAADASTRVVVLSGAGPGARAFCAGSDIGEFENYMSPGAVIEKKLRLENDTYTRLDDFAKPTIAAINGLAYGGGLELAVCCDIVIAARSAKLALPEVKLGVYPGSGGTIRVPRRIGEGRAKEMMFAGDPVDADTALSWGLVDRVAEDAALHDAVMDLAARIAAQPARAVQACKRAIENGLTLPRDEAIERSLELSDQVFASEDCQEGVRAFFARRPPRFTHR